MIGQYCPLIGIYSTIIDFNNATQPHIYSFIKKLNAANTSRSKRGKEYLSMIRFLKQSCKTTNKREKYKVED